LEDLQPSPREDGSGDTFGLGILLVEGHQGGIAEQDIRGMVLLGNLEQGLVGEETGGGPFQAIRDGLGPRFGREGTDPGPHQEQSLTVEDDLGRGRPLGLAGRGGRHPCLEGQGGQQGEQNQS